jgi:predicted lipoprotein
MKKLIGYVVLIALFFIVAYNSVYFKKLDEVKTASAKDFNPAAYARNYLNKKLYPALNKAVEVNSLISQLEADPKKAFKDHAHALGIGNIGYFLIRGEGKVTAIDENDVYVVTGDTKSLRTIKIATEFVFGNAVRDASGIININEFSNTMDFNNVSAEINKVIRGEVLPPFKSNVKKGDKVQFTGAIELNKEHLKLEDIEAIPVSVKIINP